MYLFGIVRFIKLQNNTLIFYLVSGTYMKKYFDYIEKESYNRIPLIYNNILQRFFKVSPCNCINDSGLVRGKLYHIKIKVLKQRRLDGIKIYFHIKQIDNINLEDIDYHEYHILDHEKDEI
jgi:hypothetical protein